jgi:hypothetical protein
VKLVEQRLHTKTIDRLRRFGLSHEEIYSLVVPRRTLTHRRARGEALNLTSQTAWSVSHGLLR